MKNSKTKVIKCLDLNGKLRNCPIEKVSFRPSVYGVLIRNNKILLSKQWDGYDFPGGGIEIDETIEQALEREFFEETGLRVKPLQIADCQTSFFYFHRKHQGVNGILIYYIVKKVGGKISTDHLAATEQSYVGMAEWIELKDLKKIKFYNSIDSLNVIQRAGKLL